MARRTKKIPTDSQKNRPCNNGDMRLCQVCIYNDDCPYVDDDTCVP